MSTDSQNLLATFDALPFADQQVVAAEIARRIATREENVEAGVRDIHTSAKHLDTDEWIKQFRDWTNSHPAIRNPNLDDSRESIYEGCGE